MIEPAFDYWWEGYKEWADQYISRKTRSRIAITLSVLAVLGSSFWAFMDESIAHEKADKVAEAYRIENEGKDGNGGLKTQIVRLQNQIAALEKRPTSTIIKYVPSETSNLAASMRDPDTIYQRSIAVGKVIAPRVINNQSIVTFEELYNTADLDRSLPFEYRGYVLRIVNHGDTSGFEVDNKGSLQAVIHNVVCKIVGHHQ